MDNHVEVGMLSHHYPEGCPSRAGGRSAGSWTWLCLGLWRLETGSEGHAVGFPGAVICFWSVSRQVVAGAEKIREKKPEVKHISPFSCRCCSLQLPPPNNSGEKMLCLDLCGGTPWPSSWNTSVQGNWQSGGFSLP